MKNSNTPIPPLRVDPRARLDTMQRTVVRPILLILLFGLIVGCDAPLQHRQNIKTFHDAGYYLVPNLSMPDALARQNCGAQALLTAGLSLNRPVDLSVQQLHAWQKLGATAPQVLIAARMNGLQAIIQRSDWQSLKRAVRGPGRQLVLFDSTIAYWSPLGWISRPSTQSLYHWAVVAGFARDDSRLLLAAPAGDCYAISRKSFLRRWARCDNCLVTISLPK